MGENAPVTSDYRDHRGDYQELVDELSELLGAPATLGPAARALAVGITTYTPETTRPPYAALPEQKLPLLTPHPRSTLFDRHIEDDGLFAVLAELGMGSIVFSPLAQGMLTNRYLNGIPDDSRAATTQWLSESNLTPEYLDRARALQQIADGRGQSLAQLALSWVLRVPEVTSALIGASSVAQLDDNLAALESAPLTADEIAAIEPFAVHGTGTADR